MQYDLQGKTALITGASGGLGSELAKAFWRSGSHLILTARSEKTLENLKSDLLSSKRPSQTILIKTLDLAKPDAIKTFISAIHQEKIDCLINNAATLGPVGPLWDNNWDDWQEALQVNLLAPIELCRALLPGMIERQSGKIINLSGGGATAPRPGFTAYAVAKIGLVRFTETLAAEVRPFNIEVNAIAPGRMKTAMLQEIINAGISKAGEKEYHLAKEGGNDETIQRAAELCVYLASQQAPSITGKLISAVWDPWKNFQQFIEEINSSDIYTLRRILPEDRNKNHGTIT